MRNLLVVGWRTLQRKLHCASFDVLDFKLIENLIVGLVVCTTNVDELPLDGVHQLPAALEGYKQIKRICEGGWICSNLDIRHVDQSHDI